MLLGGLSLLHWKCQVEENPSLFDFEYVKKTLITKNVSFRTIEN